MTKGVILPKKAVPAGSFMMRRVFRQGAKYICGICRQSHPVIEDANTCLEDCWEAVLDGPPWTFVKRMGRIECACIYCQRSYPNAMDAIDCAEDCCAKMSISSLDGRDLAPKRKKRTFSKPNFKPQVNFPFKIPGKENALLDARSEAERIAAEEAARANVTVAPSTETDEEKNAKALKLKRSSGKKDDAAGGPKKDRTKKFDRVGAKYSCLICQKKYFERAEVEKCFDSHTGGNNMHENSGV
jgi:hypothetical protein